MTKIKSTQIKRNGCYVYYVVSESGAELTAMLDAGIAGIIAQG